MVKASSQRRLSQPGATPSRDEAEGVSKHQPPSQGVRRNCPWTEAEHLLFLLGLEEHGRGAWRAIASDFVGTRTATQVASHAQKYFLREGLPPSKREKKRPSIHDIRCSRNASQEDRYQLRNSLQQLNRESMESNDSRHAETQHASPKPGSGPLAGRAARPRAETGSSGDTTVAAGTRPAPTMPNWSGDAAYSYGGDGGAMPCSLATEASAGRPRAWSLPDWQFPGRSTPLVSGPDAFSCGASVLPDMSDPAVGILDPLYDEVLNCDLSPDPHSGSRTAPGRASDMSLEHSFDQTQLMRGNSADTRPLFPLSGAQQTVPEDNLLLGSAPARTMLERRTPWQPPMYTPYGNANMYEPMFRSEADGAFMRGAPAGRASLPNYPPQPQHSAGGQDTMQERHMLASFDSSHCAQPSLRSSFPQAPMQGPAQSRALGDALGANMQLPQLGSLLSSQSAPPGNALTMGPYSSALYRPTQLSLATPMTTAAEPSFGAAGAAGMPSGDSVDDLRVLAQRADEMGIASDMDQQNMDEILGSMSLGMEMDL